MQKKMKNRRVFEQYTCEWKNEAECEEELEEDGENIEDAEEKEFGE
jgi:hypothetical protein